MRGHKQFFVECYIIETLPNGATFGRKAHIGNASSIKGAKSIITGFRRCHQDNYPQDFRVYDSFAEVNEKTNFVPCVYSER